MLDCYMEDHDLTKTRVVQIALGYKWHWIDTTRDRMSDEERELQELGKDCIKAGEWDTQCQEIIKHIGHNTPARKNEILWFKNDWR